MRNIKKRNFIKKTLTFFSLLASTNITRVFADWPSNTFNSDDIEHAIKQIVKDEKITPSESIDIKAPDIAENGAVVPITVNTTLTDVKNISIFVDNNPSPLTSSYDINQHVEAFVSTRVKMAKTSNVTAIVSTEYGYYSASREIKVTIGGCGG